MASLRKKKVQQFRKSRKLTKKKTLRQYKKTEQERKKNRRSFQKNIKEILGFDKILERRKRGQWVTNINPCKEIPLPGFGPGGGVLDWNGVEM